jgi:hypothetical protein
VSKNVGLARGKHECKEGRRLPGCVLCYQVSPQEHSNDDGTDADGSNEQLLQQTFYLFAFSVLTVSVPTPFIQRTIRSLHCANLFLQRWRHAQGELRFCPMHYSRTPVSPAGEF